MRLCSDTWTTAPRLPTRPRAKQQGRRRGAGPGAGGREAASVPTTGAFNGREGRVVLLLKCRCQDGSRGKAAAPAPPCGRSKAQHAGGAAGRQA